MWCVRRCIQARLPPARSRTILVLQWRQVVMGPCVSRSGTRHRGPSRGPDSVGTDHTASSRSLGVLRRHDVNLPKFARGDLEVALVGMIVGRDAFGPPLFKGNQVADAELANLLFPQREEHLVGGVLEDAILHMQFLGLLL